MPVLLLTHVSPSTLLCACIWYEHHYSFVYLGLPVKWNQLSPNNSHHTSCIHKGPHAGKLPDLMTSKQDSVSTLRYHWTDHTGRPLEPQVHWDATGTTLADASTQWCSSGNPVLICIVGTHWTQLDPQVHWDATGTTLADASTQWCPSGDPVLICIIGTHWKTTGKPLEAHWLPTIFSPVAFQCTLGSKFQAHWIASGLPLEDHWLRVRGALLFFKVIH